MTARNGPGSAAAAPAPRRTGVFLVGGYYFLLKCAVNVVFILFQTSFLKQGGVQNLPWVYTAVNVMYISVQAAFIQRLKARSADHLWKLSWLFLAVLAVRLATGKEEGMALSMALLLIVMVYDLLFNQFFFHYLNEIFPLQEGKVSLPVVTAAGSFAFIVSGFGLKLALSMVSLEAVLAAAVAALAGSQIAFFMVRDRYGAGGREEAAPVAPETSSAARPTPAVAPDQTPGDGRAAAAAGSRGLMSLGGLLVAMGFFTMAGKYWLDYQYSRAITAAFVTERDLASFIAIFTSCTDFLVLVSQFGLAPLVLERVALPAVLAFTPLAVLAGSLFTLAWPAFWPVLVTQFLFTYLTKTFHSSAVNLLLNALPSQRRHVVMSRWGMAASSGSLLVGVSLLVVQDYLSVSTAFAVLVGVFGTMLVFAALVRGAYRQELAWALERASRADGEGLGEELSVLPYPARLALLERLAGGDEAERLRAVEGAPSLQETDRLMLLLPLAESDGSPQLAARAACGLAIPSDARLRERLLGLVANESIPARVRSNLAEAFGPGGADEEVAQVLRPLASHQEPRLAASAAVSVIQRSSRPEQVEQALRRLFGMLVDDPEGPEGPRRSAALAAVGRLRHPVFLPELAAGLACPSGKLAEIALDALTALGTPDAAGVLESLARSRPEHPLAEEAKRRSTRLSTHNRLEVRQLLDGLSEQDRSVIERKLGRIRGDRKLAVFLKALRLKDPGLRKGLTEFLDKADSKTVFQLFNTALVEGPSGTDLREEALLEALERTVRIDRRSLERLCRCLLETRNTRLTQQLLSVRARRLAAETAAARRSAEPGDGASRVSEELGRDLSSLFTLAAECCDRPREAFDALESARAGDRFSASLAQEYLQSSLAPELVRDLMSLVRQQRE